MNKKFVFYIPLLSLFFLNCCVHAGDFKLALLRSPAFKMCAGVAHKVCFSSDRSCQIARSALIIGASQGVLATYTKRDTILEKLKTFQTNNPRTATIAKHVALSGLCLLGYHALKPSSPLLPFLFDRSGVVLGNILLSVLQYKFTNYLIGERDSSLFGEKDSIQFVAKQPVKPTDTFDAVQHFPALQKELNFLNNGKDCAKYNLYPLQGFVLMGIPGTGKSTILRHYMSQINNSRVIEVNTEALQSKWAGDGAKNVTKLYDDAQVEVEKMKKEGIQNPRVILFCDEIESLGTRQNNDRALKGDIITTFLKAIENPKYKNIFLLGATNNIELFDSAFTRPGRLMLIEMPNTPVLPIRHGIIKSFLEKVDSEVKGDDINYDKLAESTDKLTAAQITEVLRKASVHAQSTQAKITQKVLLKQIQEMNDKVRDTFASSTDSAAYTSPSAAAAAAAATATPTSSTSATADQAYQAGAKMVVQLMLQAMQEQQSKKNRSGQVSEQA